jgi:glycine/D-amino acid oxidase-like deaminating enzyme
MPRETADAVIIGGGVMGTSIAFQLARQKFGKVMLLERDAIASGTTGKSSAIIRMHYSNTSTIQMAWRSLEIFENFEEITRGGQAGFNQPGYLVFANEALAEGVRRNITLAQSLGVETKWIERDEVAKLTPWAKLDDIVGAAYEKRSGYADPYGVAMGFADGARKSGAVVRQNCPVTGVRVEGGKIIGVDTPRGPVDAPVVVNAAGAWVNKVAGLSGDHFPAEAIREQDTVFEAEGKNGERVNIVVYDAPTKLYFRPEGGNLLLIGRDNIDPERVDPDAFNTKEDMAFVLDVITRMTPRWPDFENARLLRGWGCLYCITEDWMPIMDRHPETAGYFVCTGMSGHGFKLSPAVGEMMAALIMTGECPEPAIRDYRLGRFAEGGLMRSEFDRGFQG